MLAAFFRIPGQNGPLRTTEFLIVFPLATHPEQRLCRLLEEIAYLHETALSVPRYDFNWQLGYDLGKPLKVPKRTKLVVTAHFNNSANNRFNPV